MKNLSNPATSCPAFASPYSEDRSLGDGVYLTEGGGAYFPLQGSNLRDLLVGQLGSVMSRTVPRSSNPSAARVHVMDIHPLSSNFKVGRIAAKSVVACMAHNHTCWDFAFMKGVGSAVRGPSDHFIIKMAVPGIGAPRFPVPAFGIPASFYPRHKRAFKTAIDGALVRLQEYATAGSAWGRKIWLCHSSRMAGSHVHVKGYAL